MSEEVRIAAAQIAVGRGEVDLNLGRHLELMAVAADEGVDLLLFPELSLTGYELDLAAELAFAPDDRRLEVLRRSARDRRLTVIVGAPIRLDQGLVLGAFVIGRGGDLAIYGKRRLGAFPAAANPGGPVPPREDSVFVVAADLDPRLELGAHRAALAICADIGDPAHAHRAATTGADLYLASMFLVPADHESDARRLAGFAREHRLLVLMANHGAPTGGLPSAGRSAAWSRAGDLLAELPAAGEGLVVVDPGRERASFRVL
ncbi:MAG: carbon-nitrogen hydrolase family protein [Planctomycetes bacterium]|nr:carbon-nitrogen hydrolase family protein [Planctomycetota bacterium]